MVTWRLVFTKQAKKDAKKLAAANLKTKTQKLLQIIETNATRMASRGSGNLSSNFVLCESLARLEDCLSQIGNS